MCAAEVARGHTVNESVSVSQWVMSNHGSWVISIPPPPSLTPRQALRGEGRNIGIRAVQHHRYTRIHRNRLLEVIGGDCIPGRVKHHA